MRNADNEFRVLRVESRRDFDRFLRCPWSLYADDPVWVPPLLQLLRERLSQQENPYFRHAEAALFIAERRGRVVGRISAQICELVQQYHDQGTGHFGMFESENRADTVLALFNAAEEWLQRRDMTRMMGPFDLSINDEVGMLVDGFHKPPFVMMGHHHEYYCGMLGNAGLSKEADLYAYHLDISKEYTKRIERIVKRASQDARIAIRSVDRSDHERQLRHILDVFKDAWSQNWGYLPPTDEEVEYLIHKLRPLLNRGLVTLAEVNHEIAGFMIVLPNLNEFIADLNGSLFPVGWLKLLWRLRYSRFSSVRVPLMGICSKYHDTRIGASVALSMIDHCRMNFLHQGVTQCEMSWVLESNSAMRGILDAAGCEPYKCYRVYSKRLAEPRATSKD